MGKGKLAAIIPIPNAMPRQKWVERIAKAWRGQLPSIFETGNLLEAAKDELAYGEWGKMIKDELPFDRTTAHRLITIASDEKLRDVAHAQHLPVSWMTLYELTKLTPDQLVAGIKSGAINPRMERKEVKALREVQTTTPKKKQSRSHQNLLVIGNANLRAK